jgi:DNA-binding MarR family transcriptional regulator
VSELLGLAAGLVRLSFLVQAIYADACGRLRITPAQAKLMCVIRDRDMGMAELASILRLEKSSLSGLIDRVEQRGHLHRRSAPADRRAVNVTLTPRGRHLADEFHGEVSRRLSEAVRHLSAPERARFARLISQVVAAEVVPVVFDDDAGASA